MQISEKQAKKTSIEAPGPYYPEQLDNSYNRKTPAPGEWQPQEPGKPDPFSERPPHCLKGFIQGVNQNFNIDVRPSIFGGTYTHKTPAPSYIHYKAVLCGREFCPDCGKNNSWIHQRRKSRWIPKAIQFFQNGFGYLVITFPEYSRKPLEQKHILSAVRSYFRRKLKREGFTRGLMRWHWFGDCKSCKGKGCKECKFTGSGKNFHPHLNILIESQRLDRIILKRWKKEFSEGVESILKKFFSKEVNAKKYSEVNFHYQFFQPGEKILKDIFHKVEYITRSTFRIYSRELWHNLKGFRNQSNWGKWKKMNLQEMENLFSEYKFKVEVKELALISYGQKICPLSGEAIKWGKFFNDISIFKILTFVTDFFPGGFFVCPPEILKVLRE